MRKRTLVWLFIPYVLLISVVLFYRTPDGLGISIHALRSRLDTSVNLIPFHTLGSYKSAYLAGNMSDIAYYLNIYGNAVLFLPMGMMLPCFFKKRLSFMRSVITFLFLILTVEAIQLLCGIGRADVDDILLNLLGAVLGRILIIEKQK